MAPSAYTLDFEKPLQELERQIEELERLGEDREIDVSTELKLLQDKLHSVREDIYKGLTPIQRVMVARHPRRPYTLDYLSTIFTDVIELHGNTTYARCIGCGQAYQLDWVKRRFDEDGGAPNCTACDEPVKTATISFGQMMPDDEMQRATALSQACDLFIAIGSSLVVWPAAGFPMMAKNAGARLVIINREPTEQDDIADLVIHHDIGETLGPFAGN